MLAFLHTSAIHVANFTRIVRELDPNIQVRHAVREDLFAQALADGRVTDETLRGTQAEVHRLVAEGARVVLCTCSTLGSAAEASPNVEAARVIRVDRPMAERAAAVLTSPDVGVRAALALLEALA